MEITKIYTNQIVEIFYRTSFSKPGLNRIKRFYKYFDYIEGIPVVEKIGERKYRLISHCENIDCFDSRNICIPSIIKNFNNDEERYLEVLKFLIDGKSNSRFKEKYHIVNTLILTISLDDISEKIDIPIKELKEYLFKEDQYQYYLITSLEAGSYSQMSKVVGFLRKNTWVNPQASLLLLNLTLKDTNGLFKLTDNRWMIVRLILEGIQVNYINLTATQQLEILKEIIMDGWTILIDHFNRRCDQIGR